MLIQRMILYNVPVLSAFYSPGSSMPLAFRASWGLLQEIGYRAHHCCGRAQRRAETHTDREEDTARAPRWICIIFVASDPSICHRPPGHMSSDTAGTCSRESDQRRSTGRLLSALEPGQDYWFPPNLQRAATMSQADVSTCSAPQRVFQEAVKQGNTKELHSLLQNMTNCEFNVNSFGPEGQTALHQSVIDGNLELVKLLVKFGADIRLANREGWSALHIAAFGGHQDIVLYLITKAKYSSGAR
ncbi:hypothetical protein KUCAC02_009178 [Chaenocephalus aceratus]|uniref:Uncharacterized protein n=1 Tax=Chaenocephalus aceratus TaxID=36190 RepID=A0ACB9WTN2_CHAAC|nr:hypothetical protein KUCAC02_009178 [Chaenocephalus aceratus]